MAKKKAWLQSESTTYSYPRVYSIVLWNTGEKDHGGTFGTLQTLVTMEIDRIDHGLPSRCDLVSLLILRDQLEKEFEKGESNG